MTDAKLSTSADSTTEHRYGIDSGYMTQFDGGQSASRSLAESGAPNSVSKCMTKAALYARVSTDGQQKEGTIESQLAELRRQVAASGHELVKEYIDDGYSGSLLDRPGLDQIAELLKNGKQIIIKGKNYVDIPENKFTVTVLGAVAEFERAKIIERTTRGRLSSRCSQAVNLGL
jgi:hypothetical protein